MAGASRGSQSNVEDEDEAEAERWWQFGLG